MPCRSFFTIFSCGIHQKSTFLKSKSHVQKSTKTLALKKVIEAYLSKWQISSMGKQNQQFKFRIPVDSCSRGNFLNPQKILKYFVKNQRRLL